MIIPLRGYRDIVLNYYDQVEIFAHYLEIEYSDVQYCLETKGYISNPLRVDKNPSLTFIMRKGKVRMIDSARREFNGDVFAIVGLLINESCSDKQGFVIICNHIINSIRPYSTLPVKYYALSSKCNLPTKSISKPTVFEHSIRNWSIEDKEYWNQHHVNLDFLNKEYIKPVNSIFINDSLYYSYTILNEGYCYNYGIYKGTSLVKYYLPNEVKIRKFRTNVKLPFENIFGLEPNEILFLNKSTKDRITFKSLITQSNDRKLQEFLNKTSFVSLSSESARIPKEVVTNLKKIYKYIFINVDNDEVGNKTKEYYKPLGIPVTFIPTDEAKDISDYSRKNSLNTSINLVKQYLCTSLEEMQKI